MAVNFGKQHRCITGRQKLLSRLKKSHEEAPLGVSSPQILRSAPRLIEEQHALTSQLQPGSISALEAKNQMSQNHNHSCHGAQCKVKGNRDSLVCFQEVKHVCLTLLHTHGTKVFAVQRKELLTPAARSDQFLCASGKCFVGRGKFYLLAALLLQEQSLKCCPHRPWSSGHSDTQGAGCCMTQSSMAAQRSSPGFRTYHHYAHMPQQCKCCV